MNSLIPRMRFLQGTKCSNAAIYVSSLHSQIRFASHSTTGQTNFTNPSRPRAIHPRPQPKAAMKPSVSIPSHSLHIDVLRAITAPKALDPGRSSIGLLRLGYIPPVCYQSRATFFINYSSSHLQPEAQSRSSKKSRNTTGASQSHGFW